MYMKKKFLLIRGVLYLFCMLFISSCSKDKSTAIDYSKIKIKQAITFNGSYYDTLNYSYSGDNVSTIRIYSNDPTMSYTSNYIKNGNRYDLILIYGTVLTYQGIYILNSQGYVDSSKISNVITSVTNNIDKHYYNNNGYSIRDVYEYNAFQNDYTNYYNSDGDNTYWINKYESFTNPANSFVDSVTFEYYSDELLVPFEYALQGKFGKSNKHLKKNRIHYDRATGTLKKTYEYFYELDAKGLVTRRQMKIFLQPGNVLTSVEDAHYTYYE